MSILGLKRGIVALVPHNEQWHALYDREATQLRTALDIAICVQDVAVADIWATSLLGLGYWNKGVEPVMPYRRFFAKGPDDCRTVYLHIVTRKEFDRLVKFRDVLNGSPELTRQYSQLKQHLATAHADDRKTYTHQKDEFIQCVLEGLTI